MSLAIGGLIYYASTQLAGGLRAPELVVSIGIALVAANVLPEVVAPYVGSAWVIGSALMLVRMTYWAGTSC